MCSEVLQVEPDNVNALKDRAEAYLTEEMYDEGRFFKEFDLQDLKVDVYESSTFNILLFKNSLP